MVKIIIKRNGSKVPYNKEKIVIAISKANKEVKGRDKVSRSGIEEVVKAVENQPKSTLSVENIQDIVERKLMELGKFELAKKYILYRERRSIVRQINTTDESILKIIGMENEEVNEENSNKNPRLLSTQRDYIAGEISKDLCKRIIIPEDIIKAHEEGVIHFHDMDYFVQKGIFNCCLINIKDMLDNGTCINGKMIETPKSFQTACTILTQVIAVVASNQYGGQSVDIRHLSPYLKKSYDKAYNKWINKGKSEEIARELAQDKMEEELKSGVQTIQYQINTLFTTNGQTPFVTLFLCLDDNDPYIEYTAMIIREIIKQREKGIQNEYGIWSTPSFPKLIYVLDENNAHPGSRFWDLTKECCKCTAKRMYPDYISAKIMRENYEGNVFSPMGCRSFLSPWKNENGEYQFEGRFNKGVVSLNLPQIGIIANGDEELFWKLFDERMQIVKKALLIRHESLKGTLSDVSPLHWQYGAIARLNKGETIDKYLTGGYSTLSIGYIGLYEVTKLMTGESQTTEKGQAFALKVMNALRKYVNDWNAEDGDQKKGWALYGTPAESLCYRFAKIDKERFGSIPDITDKEYYTNSYHVDVREHINAFDKLKFESQFQPISSGGCISYIEIPYMMQNLDVIEDLVQFMYENIEYAEFNTKSDNCGECGFEGEILLDENNEWYCPQCGNRNHATMTVTRRTCGYLGSTFWNKGKTKEISQRVLHL